ncbi:MAG: gephyrin-like molybdotransferase Glp [Flavobacteriales bacterium]
MISVEKAKNLVLTNIQQQEKKRVAINSALNYFLAEDILAPVCVPLFNQSAMDGYAFKFEDVQQQLIIVDTIPAGDVREIEIKKGEAVRIFTGSKVPDSCDTVVMQELATVTENILAVTDAGLKFGGNVRKKGDQIKEGDVALQKGTRINAAAIGFLTTLGITDVLVFDLPKITVIATGSELVGIGNPLKEGQIYESNTHMLDAAIKQLGIKPVIYVVKDNVTATERLIQEVLLDTDFLILSGGISVGDYDFVRESLLKNNVEEIFYKIKQKPGKPLFFGQQGKKAIFALPGNPAAALNCFYMYVLPAINVSLGSLNPFLPKIQLPLADKYIKKEGRAQFLKAQFNNYSVSLMLGQDSDALQSFALANGLVYISAEKETIEQHELVDVYLLPN